MLITYRYQRPSYTHFCTCSSPCLFFTSLLFHILILSFKLSCSGSPQPSPFSLPLLLSGSPYKYGTCICKCGLSTPDDSDAAAVSAPGNAIVLFSLTPPSPLPSSLSFPCPLWLQFNIHFEKAHLHLRFCGTFACASTVFCFSSRAAEWACDREGA